MMKECIHVVHQGFSTTSFGAEYILFIIVYEGENGRIQ